MIINLKETAGLACQIVFEYPHWGYEHIDDMLDTYDASGDPMPCNSNDLYDACRLAESLMGDTREYMSTCHAVEEHLAQMTLNRSRRTTVDTFEVP